MRLIIEQDAHAGSVWAAKYIVSRIKAKAEVTNQPFVLGLPTGGTPIGTYKELIKMYQAGEVSFKNVIHSTWTSMWVFQRSILRAITLSWLVISSTM